MSKILGFVSVTAALLTVSTMALAQSKMNDARIAKALITINEGEIDAGQTAHRKAQTKEVKDFADMMVTEHKNNIKETRKVAHAAKFSPEKSELSESLKDMAQSSNKDLKKTDKAAFDSAYVNQQVTMHEKALSTLNDTLIPQASSAELKSHLEKTRGAVSMHLDHAKKMQAQVK
ncbi:MAG: DUF4142 domain-containing protein [Bdellovibrionaceae bacterium]|nr:DUF4142 domain-containing protein [Bdellovibrio sp.]